MGAQQGSGLLQVEGAIHCAADKAECGRGCSAGGEGREGCSTYRERVACLRAAGRSSDHTALPLLHLVSSWEAGCTQRGIHALHAFHALSIHARLLT